LKKQYNILFLLALLLGLGLNTYAQDVPIACGGGTVRYGVYGSFGSAFMWEITGGEIVNNYNDSIDVRWEDNSGAQTITVTETSLYGCTGEPYYTSVFISSANVSLGFDAEICSGEFNEFYAVGDSIENYLWQDGSTADSYVATETDQYNVRATNTNGCVSSDTVNLTVHDLPTVNLGADTMLCGISNTLSLDAENLGSSYYWSTNDITKTITAFNEQKKQEIWVEVTNEYGCISSDTIIIDLCNDSEFLVIPTAFTPNDDGVNEVWAVDNLFVFDEVTVDIFNRWGVLVFHSKGYDSSQYWDGKDKNGNELPMDSYYYVIDFHNGEKPKIGNVTIIR
jgi:gliding motility-associated-like protein